MRITKVYTRTGDAGKTRLAGGQEVWKDSLRVDAYGTVDELNALIGVVRVWNAQNGDNKSTEAAKRLEETFRWVQNKLFDLGSLLATAPGQVFPNMPRVSDEDVLTLERSIDVCQEDLAPLREFILPGGGKVSGFLHQARTVCRRAERICVGLARQEAVDPVLITFLNRLSDALFVWARWIAKQHAEPEFLWERDPQTK
ncbi:MAG: cob(I)yrinic acid a,c-diamide adenosyltransferase [Nitrospirales bacterium]|nr:cob(I)yrinic acid a,c-diamide adenosyltransferase [Nitrospirales bacterium]